MVHIAAHIAARATRTATSTRAAGASAAATCSPARSAPSSSGTSAASSATRDSTPATGRTRAHSARAPTPGDVTRHCKVLGKMVAGKEPRHYSPFEGTKRTFDILFFTSGRSTAKSMDQYWSRPLSQSSQASIYRPGKHGNMSSNLRSKLVYYYCRTLVYRAIALLLVYISHFRSRNGRS